MAILGPSMNSIAVANDALRLVTEHDVAQVPIARAWRLRYLTSRTMRLALVALVKVSIRTIIRAKVNSEYFDFAPATALTALAKSPEVYHIGAGRNLLRSCRITQDLAAALVPQQFINSLTYYCLEKSWIGVCAIHAL